MKNLKYSIIIFVVFSNLVFSDEISNKINKFWDLYKKWQNVGEFEKFFKNVFRERRTEDIAKILGVINFEEGDYTESNKYFSLFDSKDPEYLYFYGRTLEKLNLYTEAVEVYNKIKEGNFKEKAEVRLKDIEASKLSYSFSDLPKEVKRIIKKSPSEKEYPQAGAIILLDKINYKVLEDSTSIIDVHFIAKILNDRGKKKYGELELSYDSTDESVEILYARTIKPDEKKVVPVGKKQIRDVSKYLNFPLYSNVRVKIISFPEVEKGSIVEYRARYYVNKLIGGKFFVYSFGIQGREPNLRQIVNLEVPIKLGIDYKIYRRGFLKNKEKLKPRIKYKGKFIKYSWRIDNVPEIIKEDNMPPWAEIVDYVRISNFKNWNDIYKWWKNLVKDKIEINQDIKKKIEEITKDEETLLDKVKKVYAWVCENIRYVAVEYGEAGFRPHKAEEIFLNKYGDCKGQAILLIAMLRYLGVKAYPVLIGTVGTYPLDKDFPSLYFNHAICAVEINKNIIFLDPTSEVAPFGDLPSGDQGRNVLLFKDDSYEILRTPLMEPKRNRVVKEMKIFLKENKIEGKRVINTYGVYNQGQRWYFKYTKRKEIEETLKQKINSITPGGKLLNYEISGMEDLNRNVVLKMDFEGEKFFSVAGNLRIVPEWGGLSSYLVALEKRKYPLYFRFLSEKEISINIFIPENYSVFYLPPKIEVDNDWFYFLRKYEFNEGVLKCYEDYKIKKRIIGVKEYTNFRKIYNNILKEIDDKAVLKVKDK